MFFWPSFLRLTEHIKGGNLDILLTKPVDLQFIMTLRHLSFSMIFPNLIGGFGLLIYGWYKSGKEITILGITGYLLFVLLGSLLIYSLFLIPKAFLSFWFISSSSADMLISSVWEANNMPMFIYGKAIRFIGMYIIPVFLIANFPPMWIMETLSIQNIIWELAVVCVTFGMARVIFRQGVKRYNSASS